MGYKVIPLPSVRPVYEQKMLDTLSPAERQAAFYGVEKRFLRYASKEYIEDPQEQYNLHHFNTIRIEGYYETITIPHDVQFNHALELLNSGHLWCDPPALIVINAPNYLFDGTAKEMDRGPDAFLAHLVCSLAYRTMNRKAPSDVAVNFLECMQLNHVDGYILKPRHLLVWGPVTDHFNSYDYNKTVQFLFSFRNYTRILLTSTKNLGELLGKLHINLAHVTYYFNFDVKKEAKTREEIIVEIKERKALKVEKKADETPEVKKEKVSRKKKATVIEKIKEEEIEKSRKIFTEAPIAVVIEKPVVSEKIVKKRVTRKAKPTDIGV